MTRKKTQEKKPDSENKYIALSNFTDVLGAVLKGSIYESSKERIAYLEKLGLIEKL